MPTFIKLQHAYNYVDIESENKTVARDEILTPSKIQKVQTSKLIIVFFYLRDSILWYCNWAYIRVWIKKKCVHFCAKSV